MRNMGDASSWLPRAVEKGGKNESENERQYIAEHDVGRTKRMRREAVVLSCPPTWAENALKAQLRGRAGPASQANHLARGEILCRQLGS